jgi:hypothetical protein
LQRWGEEIDAALGGFAGVELQPERTFLNSPSHKIAHAAGLMDRRLKGSTT